MGGAETHVCNLANQLTERGHFVSLLSRPGNQKKLLSSQVDHHDSKINDFNLRVNTFRLKNIIEERNIDLVHGHQRLGILLASKAAKKTGVPSLATVHGKLKYDIRSTAVRKSLDHVISVRKSTSDEIARCSILRNKSTMILNGVRSYPRTHSECHGTIMYGSRMDKRHSWLLLLLIHKVLPDLRNSLPEIRLVIFGAGDFQDAICKAAKEVNQKNAGLVEFRGFTAELGREYQSASLVIACARSAMDALVNGTCVLAGSYHHLGEVITPENFNSFSQDNFECRGYPKPNAETLKNRIEDFFDKKESHQEGMKDMQDSIYKELSMDSSLNKTLEIYQSLISG